MQGEVLQKWDAIRILARGSWARTNEKKSHLCLMGYSENEW